jgi:hypothetical protein
VPLLVAVLNTEVVDLLVPRLVLKTVVYWLLVLFVVLLELSNTVVVSKLVVLDVAVENAVVVSLVVPRLVAKVVV